MNKFKGTVKISSEIKNKLAIAQMKILVFKMIITKDIITKEQIVKINKIAKKKKSSAGPTSFSFSFKINNLVKLFI
jgi:hypothetical protein